MILGIGTDLVSVARIARLHQRYGDAFSRRILAPSELLELPTAAAPAHFLAKRFAVKEAVVKALGCGFGNGVAPRQIALLRYLVENEGRPVARKTILDRVWNVHEDTDTRAIDNFVVRLRRYIEDEPTRPRHLQTVRGIGYRFVANPDGEPRTQN